MVAILMMSAILATLGLLKMKVSLNKAYDVIISVHQVTNKILLRDSSLVKFGNSSISMREVIIRSYFIRIWPEKPIFQVGSSSII